MTLSPWLKHALWALPLMGGLAMVGFAWQASQWLVSPKRRPLQDYHEQMLNNPARYGMRVLPFETSQPSLGTTPCLNCEPTTLQQSEKGRRLRSQLTGWGVSLPASGETVGTLLLIHGHSGRKEDLLPVAERFCAVGFRCLLFDVPGHGHHSKASTSFGLQELSIPKAVLKQAANMFGFQPDRAGLFGVSQGGAIALQAAADDQSLWQAVAELSAFATLPTVIHHKARRLGPLAVPTAAVMRGFVRLRAGFDPRQVRPIDSVAQLATMPVLIGHGDRDNFVTPDQAQLLFDTCPSPYKKFFTIPEATHGQVFITEAPVYATLSQFFLEAMGTTPFTR